MAMNINAVRGEDVYIEIDLKGIQYSSYKAQLRRQPNSSVVYSTFTHKVENGILILTLSAEETKNLRNVFYWDVEAIKTSGATEYLEQGSTINFKQNVTREDDDVSNALPSQDFNIVRANDFLMKKPDGNYYSLSNALKYQQDYLEPRQYQNLANADFTVIEEAQRQVIAEFVMLPEFPRLNGISFQMWALTGDIKISVYDANAIFLIKDYNATNSDEDTIINMLLTESSNYGIYYVTVSGTYDLLNVKKIIVY